MAISLKAAGTWAALTADGAVSIPGSPAAGDRMYLFASWKDFSITAQVSGWTEITEFADGAVGQGNGTGSMKVGAWYRDWQSGDGNPTLDFSASPNIAGAVIQVWQKGAAESWNAPLFATAAWPSQSTGTVAASGTTAVASGATVMALIGIRDDSTLFTRLGATGIDVASGITWNGDYQESPATHLTTTTANDMAADLGYRLVTTGGTVTLRVTATLTAAETGAILWVHQSVFTPETHSGAATGTGGGVATSTGRKAGASTATATGGGVATTSARKAAAAPAMGAGGGVAAASATTARAASATATGAGIASLSAVAGRATAVGATGAGTVSYAYEVSSVEEYEGSLTATGGGVISLSAMAARGSGVTATAGGQATVVAVAARSGDVVASAGGSATLSGSSARAGAAVVTGAGQASASIESARLAAALMSGGGVLTTAQATARLAAAAGTGGGEAHVSGSSLEARSGSVAATGGGIASIEAVTARLVAALASGAGGATFLWSGAHVGALSGTGAGQASVGAPELSLKRAQIGLVYTPAAAVLIAQAGTLELKVQ